MSNIGAPSKYTDELADEICARLANGEPLKRICADPHMPDFVTVWRWERDKEPFRNLLARARELGTHNLADQCIDIADDPDMDPANKRVMIETRIRLIGKWNSRAYGDKQTTTLENPDGSAVQFVIRDMTKTDGA